MPLGAGFSASRQSDRCEGAYESHERTLRALPLSYRPVRLRMDLVGLEPTTSPSCRGLYALAVGYAPAHRSDCPSMFFVDEPVRQLSHPRESHKRCFAAPVISFSKWGGKDSNLHPPPEGAAGASSLYAPAVGRGRESCRTGLVVVSPYVVLHAQPKTASGRTVRLPLAWRSTV